MYCECKKSSGEDDARKHVNSSVFIRSEEGGSNLRNGFFFTFMVFISAGRESTQQLERRGKRSEARYINFNISY